MAPWLAIPLHKWPSAVPQLFCWLHNNINHQKNTPNLAEASPAFLVSHGKAWCCGPSTYQGTVMMISFMYFSWQTPRKNSAWEKQAETGLQQIEGTNMKPREQQQGFKVILGYELPEKMSTIYILNASENTGWLEGFTEILWGWTCYLWMSMPQDIYCWSSEQVSAEPLYYIRPSSL